MKNQFKENIVLTMFPPQCSSLVWEYEKLLDLEILVEPIKLGKLRFGRNWKFWDLELVMVPIRTGTREIRAGGTWG